jgi:hypothetical protein
MGPDELATREELGLIVKLLLAKIGQQADLMGKLLSVLQDKSVFTNQEVIDLSERLKDSPQSIRASKYLEKLREFAAIHKIARQYLDPPED